MPASVEREARPRPRRGQKAAVPPPAPSSVVFKHPAGDRARRIKPGFAWDLFLFSGVLGIPLFLRGLPGWGAVVLALWLADLVLGRLGAAALHGPVQLALFAAFLGLQLWLGWNGNALTARACRARGWVADNQRDEAVRCTLQAWRIAAD